MAQIRQVVSEALQAKVRSLLPSQAGFTEDLQASNVITPIIDLTASAEGASLPQYLQVAFSLGNITSFSVNNTTSTLVNNTGFYRVFGVCNVTGDSATRGNGVLSLTDGLSTKNIIEYELENITSGAREFNSIPFDFTIFLDAGKSLTCTTNTYCVINGNTEQVADISGNLVNPSGFSSS